MADIRIKDLATTATSAASDDYLALDGSANGTRKILATNVAQNVTDVTFGSSGPSAKSSIAARAARQGLVFDGTSQATSSRSLGSIWTVPVIFTVPASNPSARATIWALNDSGGGYSNATSLSAFIGTGGELFIRGFGASASDSRIATVSGFVSSYGGKVVSLTAVQSGGTLQLYLNGTALAFTETTAGTAPAWNATWLSTFILGGNGGNSYFTGFVSSLGIYNRALSAAEVVALYEAGVPAGGDYNTASNTSKLTGANSDFSSAGNWTVTGATTISGGKLNLSNGDQAYCIPGTISVPIGAKFRVTITVDSITAGSVQVYTGGTGGWVNIATTAGTFTQEFTFSATTGTNTAINLKSVGGNAVVDTVLYYQIGLLLAPDAGQAGGGLTWYDTSGNSANITLPASGVTWNVPTSSYWGGNLTVGGSKVALPSGALLGMTVTTALLTSTNYALFQDATQTFLNVATGGSVQLRVNNVEQLRVFSNGNVGIGVAGTDGGQKLQVAGTGYFSEQVTSARPFMSTGAITANMTSAGGVGFSGGSANFYSFGANTTTSGGFAFQSVSSNASVNFNALTLAANTGDATFAGTVRSTIATLYSSQTDLRNTVQIQASTTDAKDRAGFLVRGATGNDDWYILGDTQGGSPTFRIGKAASSTLTDLFTIDKNYGIIRTQGGTAYTPASASATGTAGTIAWDASYIYVCTAANTWKRVAIATW